MNQATDKFTHGDIAEHRTDLIGWVCRKCNRYWGKDERMARYCCTRQNVCDCGGLTDPGWSACSNCRSKRDVERTQKRVESATKMTVEEAESLVCVFIEDEHYGFDGVGELIESINWHGGPSFPLYVWATREESFSLTIDHAIESACEEHHEDMYDHLSGIKELEAEVEKFNKLNESQKSYYPDYGRVLIVESLEQIGLSNL